MRSFISALSAIAVLFSSFQVSATDLKSKNDASYYLDIRQVDLPWYLRSHSEYDEGIAIYKCVIASDDCALLTEAVTYEELRKLLRRHNITYSVAAIGALIALWWALPVGAGAGIGGVSAATALKIIGTSFGTGIVTIIPGSLLALRRIGEKNVDREEIEEDFRLATFFSSEMWVGGTVLSALVFGFEAASLVGPIALGALAGGIGSVGARCCCVRNDSGTSNPCRITTKRRTTFEKTLK